MIVNVHSHPKKVVTIVDSNLIGKIFTEGKRQLDVTSTFYKGGEHTPAETIALCRGAYIIHFIGIESVTFGKQQRWIEHTMTVANIPHAEVLLIQE
jgi:hypothetical protein